MYSNKDLLRFNYMCKYMGIHQYNLFKELEYFENRSMEDAIKNWSSFVTKNVKVTSMIHSFQAQFSNELEDIKKQISSELESC